VVAEPVDGDGTRQLRLWLPDGLGSKRLRRSRSNRDALHDVILALRLCQPLLQLGFVFRLQSAQKFLERLSR